MRFYPRVLANSLPKSGTHLLDQLLRELGFKQCKKVHLSASLVRITERNPVQRMKKRMRLARADSAGVNVDIDVANNEMRRDWLRNQLSKIPQQNFIQGHCPYSNEIISILNDLGFKTLFIIRDPRDVVVSYYKHMMRIASEPLHKFFAGLENDYQRLKYVIEGIQYNNCVLSPIDVRLNNVMGWLHNEHVCTTRFEELIGPEGKGSSEKQITTVKKVVRYLSIDVPEDNFSGVADKVFSTHVWTFRKGQIGDWRNYFNEGLKELFKRKIGDILINLGYEKDKNW